MKRDMIRTDRNHIYIYGQIGWNFDAADVMAALAEVEKQHSEYVVHLHSRAGYVIDGFAIFNALRRSRMAVTVLIGGMVLLEVVSY